jgi:lipoprotein-anchoring transpeptidase ErfK/SrfK
MKIEIDVAKQQLAFGNKVYAVSTSKNGLGELNGSFCTPRGRHVVRAKIGAGQPLNAVFVRRRPTGELWSPQLHAAYLGRDWILTRILWLSGCEPGFNRLGAVDTMRRYIYIHGSPDLAGMGKPGSIGCIRMRCADIVELFELFPPYTQVEIRP